MTSQSPLEKMLDELTLAVTSTSNLARPYIVVRRAVLDHVAAIEHAREKEADYEDWILDLIHAEGSRVEPSVVAPGFTSVIDGRTGKDVCERSPERCFQLLWAEHCLHGAIEKVVAERRGAK